MEAVMCHSKSHNRPFCPTSFTCKVHSNKSLVWLQVCGLCYTIDPGPSQRLRYSAAALSHGDRAALILQNWSLYVLQFLD